MRLRRVLVAVLVTILMVPALVLTTDRALGLSGGLWVRLVSFTPLAIPLYLMALLLLLPAVFRRRRLRTTARLLALVAVVGVALHVTWASGPYLGGHPRQSAARAPVHVMTVNLRLGGADTARVVELAVEHRIDVLVLEEVTPQALAGLRSAGLGQVFPDSAGAPAPGPRGTMVFSRTALTGVRRLPTGFGSYAMDVGLPGIPDAPDGRVHLVAVHPRPPTGSAASWRADQAVVARAARGFERPTMVVGDLNATMDHAPMRDLVGHGFADAATQAKSGWQPTWPSAGEESRFGVAVPPLLAIDHVFVDGLRAVRTATFRVDGTDHRALAAALYP